MNTAQNLNIIRTITFDDALKQPLTIRVKDTMVQLDALVTAVVEQQGEDDLEVLEFDLDEVHMVVPGLQDELVKLDLVDFRANQKDLYLSFCGAIQEEVIRRAKAADENAWEYSFDEA